MERALTDPRRIFGAPSHADRVFWEMQRVYVDCTEEAWASNGSVALNRNLGAVARCAHAASQTCRDCCLVTFGIELSWMTAKGRQCERSPSSS